MSEHFDAMPTEVTLDLSASMPSAALAKIVIPCDRRAIRTIITGKKTVTTAMYPSAKNKACLCVEGETDLAAVKCHEALTTTRRYISQPFRIELTTSQGVFRSIPDGACQGADGTWELIEYKREWDKFRSESGVQQGLLGQIAADALGVKYSKIAREALGSDDFLENVSEVQGKRFVPFSLRHEYSAANLLSMREEVALGDLAEALHPEWPNGCALACAMMVGRRVKIDLSGELGRDSLVTAAEPEAADLPDLFDKLFSLHGAG